MTAFDINETIIVQYDASPRIRGLIDGLGDAINPQANIDAFYNLLWNVETAEGYGLDVWGRIVGVNRVLQVASGDFLGFEEAADPSMLGFNQAPFYGPGSTTNYPLTDDAFRQLILVKALANICDGSSKAINTLLVKLFPSASGNAYVADNQDMTMTYTFEFPLDPVQSAIVNQSGVLPKTVGVAANVVMV